MMVVIPQLNYILIALTVLVLDDTYMDSTESTKSVNRIGEGIPAVCSIDPENTWPLQIHYSFRHLPDRFALTVAV